jgi:dTMP kinase
MNKGKEPRFLTVEGGEGAGKSTLLTSLAETLSSWGFQVVQTREPGGTHLGNEIRNWLLNHHQEMLIGSKAELLMFLAARAQHVEELIGPAIGTGKVVLCDRFNDSTVAYQGVARGLGFKFVQDLCAAACGTTMPDLTFYLDIDPVIGLQRTKRISKENAAAGEVDRIESEKIEFHQRVRQAFQDIARAEPERCFIIDAAQSREQVAQACKEILLERFERAL